MTRAAEVGRQGIVAIVAAVLACVISQGALRPAVMHAQAPSIPTASSPLAPEDRGIADAPLPPLLATAPSPPFSEGEEALSPQRFAAPLKAAAAYDGEPRPGLEIRLLSEGSSPEGHLRWLQVRGPEASLDDPTARSPVLIVPRGEGSMEFVVIVSNEAETATARVSVPIWSARPDPEVARASTEAVVLRPDAGDDQIGISGRQITLNGGRSEPRSGVGYRWVQIAGPSVRLALDEGSIYSFVPQAPGVYQFALLIASGSRISEPDTVSVTVGNPSGPFGPDASPTPSESLHEMARSCINQVPGGLDVADALGEAFDGVADRMDLYRSYSEAFHELGRRLERLVPTEPTRLGVWNERLFLPLTTRLIDGLRPEGLDLRLEEARSAALSSGQRAKLAELFRAMARGFRSARPAPSPSPAPR